MIMDVTWKPSNAMQVDSDDSWIDHNRLVKTDVYEITGRKVSIVPVTKKGGDLGRVVRKMVSINPGLVTLATHVLFVRNPGLPLSLL